MRVCLCSSSCNFTAKLAFIDFCIRSRYRRSCKIGQQKNIMFRQFALHSFVIYREICIRKTIRSKNQVICWQWRLNCITFARERRIFFNHGRTLLTSPRTKSFARVDHYVRAEISFLVFYDF